jgi:hypothetical protein
MRIATYAGRYAFTPLRNCPTAFPVNPTIRMQQSGASWVTGKWKTEVESDLMGVGRPSPRWHCDSLSYNPSTNEINQAGLSHPPDESSPLTFNRLTNPPCTLRATGWNRWQPLFHNPQVSYETPFDFHIPSREADKEKFKTHVNPDVTFTSETVDRISQVNHVE